MSDLIIATGTVAAAAVYVDRERALEAALDTLELERGRAGGMTPGERVLGDVVLVVVDAGQGTAIRRRIGEALGLEASA